MGWNISDENKLEQWNGNEIIKTMLLACKHLEEPLRDKLENPEAEGPLKDRELAPLQQLV